MKILIKFLPSLLLVLPFIAQAECSADGGLCNPLGYDDLTTFLNKVLEIVVQIGFPAIVLFTVYVGFLYVSASGNPEKIKKVHALLLWLIVGALLILGAQALSIAIQSTVNQLQAGVV